MVRNGERGGEIVKVKGERRERRWEERGGAVANEIKEPERQRIGTETEDRKMA